MCRSSRRRARGPLRRRSRLLEHRSSSSRRRRPPATGKLGGCLKLLGGGGGAVSRGTTCPTPRHGRASSADISTEVATLAIPLVGLPIGYAVFLATKDAWLAALVWATIGIVLACGSYLLWQNLRRDL